MSSQVNDSQTEKSYKVPGDRLTQAVSNLEGEILTVLDAAISDPEQRKALKSVTRRAIWRWEVEWNSFVLDTKVDQIS